MNKLEYINRVPIDKDNKCIYRITSKCNNCGACKGICKSRMGVYGQYDMKKAKKPICIYCGQCSLVCPNKSINEVKDYKKVIKIMKNKTVIFQIAPAVRVLVGDEFGYKAGKDVTGKIITCLKLLGAKYVFDTSFGADLTICEEGNEFLDRLQKNEKLPIFTSCCPAWVKYLETFYPQYKSYLSTTKSPILMTGSIIKNYFAKKNNLNDVVVVSVVPCTAKKYEITKSNDVDYAITVRELCRWIKEENIDFRKLKSSRFDLFTGTSSGIIFGSSGGVMEAMIRYIYYKLTNRTAPKKFYNFECIRGLDDIKKASIKIKDKEIKVVSVNGTSDVPKLIQMIQDGEKFDIVEVMACDGGCIAGGGGSKVYKITNMNKNKRSASLYKKDLSVKRRSSYENPLVKKVYKDFLGYPNSEIAKKFLHIEGDNNE